MIQLEKSRFLEVETEDSKSAREFAASLGVGSGPLELCSRALAAQLRQPELDPLRLLFTLGVARNAYAGSL